ncbi:hypothetical protein HY251_01285, partial [bacterium]|nr:hypothetical protein [bacterium]
MMRSRGATGRFAIAALLVVASGSSGATLSFLGTVQAAEPDEAFREGVRAFDEGRFEDAEKAFREVLKAKPSDEQARLYRDEASYQFWVKVLARGGNLAVLGQRILSAAERGAKRDRQDPAKIKRVIDLFMADDDKEHDLATQMGAMEEAIALHGHYIVPYLVDALGQRREDDKRVRVIGLLARLGEEGVLALLQCLKSGEALTRQNAAI